MLDPVWTTTIVILLAFILFVTEWIPAAVTALAATATLIILGVLDAKDGFSGFSNEATLTVLFMLILAAGVERTGIVNLVAHKVLDVAHGRPQRFLLLLI